jgi:hypothetical protein
LPASCAKAEVFGPARCAGESFSIPIDSIGRSVKVFLFAQTSINGMKACGTGFMLNCCPTMEPTRFTNCLPVSSSVANISTPRSAIVPITPISKGFGIRKALSPILNHQKVSRSQSSRRFQSSSSL